jgi:hypothetical protein
MNYKFRVTRPFARAGIVDFTLDSKEEVELVKSFMLRLAPEIARTALRSDLSPDDCAERTLYWAMHLTSRYTAFAHEALKALKAENPVAPQEQQTPPTRGTLHAPRHDVDTG